MMFGVEVLSFAILLIYDLVFPTAMSSGFGGCLCLLDPLIISSFSSGVALALHPLLLLLSSHSQQLLPLVRDLFLQFM